MNPQTPLSEGTERLTRQLVLQLKPVERFKIWSHLWPYAAVGCAVVVSSAFFVGLRPGLAEAALALPFVLETLLLAGLALLFGYWSLGLGIPGRSRSPGRLTLLALSLMGIWLLFIGSRALVARDGWFDVTSAAYVSLPCVFELVVVGALPVVFLRQRVRALAPTAPGKTFFLVTAAGLFFGAFALQLTCPMDTSGHLFVWHFLPLFALAAVAVLLGKRFLKW